MIKKIITFSILISFSAQIFLSGILFSPKTVFAQNSTTNKDANDSGWSHNEIWKLGLDMDKYASYSEIENRLKINDYDKKRLDEFKRASEFLGQNPNASEEDALKAIGAKKLQIYDIRLLRSLHYLVTSRNYGGADHEWLNVYTMVKGYVGDKKQYEQDNIFPKGKTKTISPHSTGKAAKITEIDYMRYTYVKKDEKGNIVKKKKLKKEPIEMKWQDEKKQSKPNQTPDILNQSPLQMINNLGGNATNDWLSDALGNDYSGLDTEGRTPPQVIKALGSADLNDEYGFSEKNDTAFSVYNIQSLGEEIGSVLLTEGFREVIGKKGYAGNNLYEWQLSAGRTTVEDRMTLPNGSLIGENSDQILSRIGERKMEESLKLSEGSLYELKNRDDLEEKIGNGYLYKINMDWWNFYGKDVNEVKNRVGEERFEAAFYEPLMVDQLLSIEAGTAQKLKSGQLSPMEFKKIIGRTIIENKILYLEESDKCAVCLGKNVCIKTHARDEFFGLGTYDPDPCKKDNPKSKIDRFLDGDQSVYKEIGIEMTARIFANTDETQEAVRNWMRNKSVDLDANGMPKIILETIASNYGLKEKDLWAIFIDSYPGEIFQRVGYTQILASLTENESELTPYLPMSQNDDFYNSRFEQIQKEAKSIASDKKVKSEGEKISQLAETAKNFQNNNSIDYLVNMKNREIINNAYEIAKLLPTIEKNSKKTNELKIIRKKINEIIESRELKNLSDFNADSINGLYFNSAVGLTSENFIDVLKDKTGINEYKLKIGLEKWASQMLNTEEEGLLYEAYQDIIKNPKKKPSDLIAKKIGSDKITEAADYLSSAFELDENNKINYWDIVLFLNGDYKLLMKIGSSRFDTALSFSAGGIYNILNGRSNWGEEQNKSSINNLWQALGLGDYTPGYDGNILNRLSQNLLEQNLGLSGNSFYGSMDDVISRNGMDPTLSSFGITIPNDISSLKYSNPAMYEIKLKEFYNNQIKNSGSDFWKQNSNIVNQVLQTAGLNLNVQNVQDLFSGKAQIGDILNTVGRTFDSKITNDLFNSYFQLENTFNQANQLLGALKSNNLGQIYGIMQGVSGMNFDSLAGGLPIQQMLSDPKNAGKIGIDFMINQIGQNLGIGGNLLSTFFQKGVKTQDIINSLAGAIGQAANIPIASALSFLQGDPSKTLLAMGAGYLQQQLGGYLPINDILTAYTDIKPGSDLSNLAWSNAYAKASQIPGWNEMNEQTKNIVSYDFYKDELGKIKNQASQNVLYGFADAALSKAFPGSNFIGVMKGLTQGSIDDKIFAAGSLLAGMTNSKEANQILSGVMSLNSLAKYFKDPKNNAVPMEALASLGQNLGIPPVAMQALGLALNGNKTNFEKLGTQFMTGQLFGLLDKGLGSGVGSMMAQAFSMAQTYSALASNLDKLSNSLMTDYSSATAKQWFAAQAQLNMFQASMVSNLISMFAGPVLSQIDQALGIPISSLLLNSMVYSAMVPGLTAQALMGLMAPQLLFAALALFGGGLLGGSKGGTEELHISACGHWPLFEERKELNLPDFKVKCPKDLVLKMSKNNEKQNEKLLKAFKKEAAKFKNKLFIYNILKMPTENKTGKFLTKEEMLKMLPTQVRTYSSAVLREFDILIRDTYYDIKNIPKDKFWKWINSGTIRQGVGYDEKFFLEYKDYGF